jgi:hypothetical protein
MNLAQGGREEFSVRAQRVSRGLGGTSHRPRQLARSGDATRRVSEGKRLDRDSSSGLSSLAFPYRGPDAFGLRGRSGRSRKANSSNELRYTRSRGRERPADNSRPTAPLHRSVKDSQRM